MVQAIQVLRFHLLELEKVSYLTIFFLEKNRLKPVGNSFYKTSEKKEKN